VHQFIDPILGYCRWQPGFPRQLPRQFLLFHAFRLCGFGGGKSAHFANTAGE